MNGFEQPQEMLVINPVAFGDLKKYIWFDKNLERRKSALSLFFRFLDMEIPMEGFATDDEEYIGASAFNRPIVGLESLKSGDAVAFIETECDDDLYADIQPFEIMNPVLIGKKVIIFGAGKYGTEVYGYLSRKNVQIECFADSSKVKCHEAVMPDKPAVVFIDDVLREYATKDIAIIEAAEKYKEMDTLLRKWQFRGLRCYYNNERQTYLEYVFGVSGDKLLFSINAITNMCVMFSGKRIFFYGEQTSKTRRMANQIRILGFDFQGFLYDEEAEEGQYCVKYAEDILYEENAYIIMLYDEKKVKKLEDLGLKKGTDFNILPELGFDSHVMKSMLDLNLGYTYPENGKYPGIAVYGDDEEDDFKIAVLGGSTTDDLYDERNWARILYEMLCRKDRKVTIYNGGVSGYASTQELIKLIRDILPLKPDLVLVYDVYNDLCENPEQPFAFPYLQTVFQYAKNSGNIEKKGEAGYGGDVSTINLGVKTNENYFENWLSKMEIMHAVTAAKKIPFLAFAQPTRYSMNNKRIKDEWFYSSFVFWLMDHHPAMDFRERLSKEKIEEHYGYITDLNDIFDDFPEAYKDSCHLWERGNKIVAERILAVIEKKGFLEVNDNG